MSNASQSAGPDSIFVWQFQSHSGQAWGGTLVADSQQFAPGTTIQGAAGTYTILSEEERGLDLTGVGLEDGQVFVEWYLDGRSGGFLATRNGAALPSGSAGLGSEVDAAWNGLTWDSFGRGGLDLVDAPPAPASVRYSWVFVATSGDRWTGDLFERDGLYVVGSSVATAFGQYVITSIASMGGGPGPAAGTVQLTGRYFDAASGWTLGVQALDGASNNGIGGLGSELGAAWNGQAWIPFGYGGGLQANLAFDSVYTWYFADGATGDVYRGYLVDDSARYDPNQTIALGTGVYW
ncbi:hypothetical protein, partial [Falsiroseomonas oryzae]|uniref:hypothetical protein n=1 Tax=Falsiroseomonas oryzae TaxID=2766473 RepID=UPI0022EB4123